MFLFVVASSITELEDDPNCTDDHDHDDDERWVVRKLNT